MNPINKANQALGRPYDPGGDKVIRFYRDEVEPEDESRWLKITLKMVDPKDFPDCGGHNNLNSQKESLQWLVAWGRMWETSVAITELGRLMTSKPFQKLKPSVKNDYKEVLTALQVQLDCLLQQLKICLPEDLHHKRPVWLTQQPVGC